jgi:hypothetical protein
MQDKESPAARYRRLAQECLATANTTANVRARASLIQMAQVWLRLAEEQDAAIPPPSPVEQSQPVAQQQQQVQHEDDDDMG